MQRLLKVLFRIAIRFFHQLSLSKFKATIEQALDGVSLKICIVFAIDRLTSRERNGFAHLLLVIVVLSIKCGFMLVLWDGSKVVHPW